MAKQITFGVSVPSQAYIDLIDKIARQQSRSRSQQVCRLIIEEARRLGITVDTKQLELAK